MKEWCNTGHTKLLYFCVLKRQEPFKAFVVLSKLGFITVFNYISEQQSN